MVDRICGVYKIENTVTGKVYVGSSVHVRQRWYKHKALLRKNKHTNAKLQASWNKHGECAFKFSLLEVVDNSNDLIDIEKHWLDALCAVDNGYNINPIAGTTLGFKHSEETKRKLSEHFKGKQISEEQRINMSIAMKGSKIPESVRAKISAKIKELAKDPNYQGRKNFDRTGKKQTPEQVAKRVEATRLTKERNKLQKEKELEDERMAELSNH